MANINGIIRMHVYANVSVNIPSPITRNANSDQDEMSRSLGKNAALRGNKRRYIISTAIKSCLSDECSSA